MFVGYLGGICDTLLRYYCMYNQHCMCGSLFKKRMWWL